MPRHKYTFIEGRENNTVNCFAYYRDKRGVPSCHALNEIYCLKDRTPCAFYCPPHNARTAIAFIKAHPVKKK
ncbi:MAG: hypothetical protein LBN02_05480 [Oscillospiraceae bacterium]|jgi:hypothetical protein|nr:hypothetical protein [Oscillospiraceae bacterium]